MSILFENNAIKTSILLTINNKSKEEILRALSETIEEIDIPLHQYLSKSNNHNEFYNISIDDNNSANFDILIDNSTINSNTNNNNTATTIILRKNIQKYGDILVKKVKKTLDKNTTQNFIESLHKYTIDKNNKIGLAILVGESIEQESYKQINQIKDKNIREYIILIEKSALLT
ncbi:MAG TPA: hypothetical protein VFK40_13070 [Nitrososphaeraceae archaeon]|nr:hypothetical protein [Nitrososphaeraceae archaeon]